MADVKDIQQKTAYRLQKRYYSLLNNLLGVERNGLATPEEIKLMEVEIRHAKKLWKNAAS